jgi:hypothetical protein
MDTPEHTLNAQEIHFGMRGGTPCKKAPLPTPHLYLQRAGLIKSKRQRLARICDCDNHRIKSKKKGTVSIPLSI